MREQRFAGAGGADEQDVRLGQLHVTRPLAIHVDALVVVVDGDGELLLRLLLADDVFVEEDFYFGRLRQMVRRSRGMRFCAIVFQDGVADGDALVANVSPRIIARRGDEFGNSVLRFMAERTTKCFVRTRAGLHLVSPPTLTRSQSRSR